MTTHRPAAPSEGADSVGATSRATSRPGVESDVVIVSPAAAPMTRREARAREREAALAAASSPAAVVTPSSASLGAPTVGPQPLESHEQLRPRQQLRLAAPDAGAHAPGDAARPSASGGAVRPSAIGDAARLSASGGAVRSSATDDAARPSNPERSRAAERPRGARRPRAATAPGRAAQRAGRATERASRTTLASGRIATPAGRTTPPEGRTATTPRRTAAQRTTRLGAVAAMLFVGATIVSTSVPANAYFVDTPEHVAVKLAAVAQSGTTVGGSPARGQKFVASTVAGAEDLGRDGYSITSKVQGIKNTSTGTFTNDASAAVQWPFAVGVPISSGFGSRQVANCSFCSTFHQGLDFTPGAGAPIQIIADGTVSKVDQGSGALGYNVWIDHVINGTKVTSVYAHMKAGSIRVTQGQQVKVGQIVGLVGSTGNSTGAHLHFEIHLAGVPVDPYPWLEANAGKA